MVFMHDFINRTDFERFYYGEVNLISDSFEQPATKINF